MGRSTGAFVTEVQRDPAVFRPENLSKFDAVFLNNTVGNLFDDPMLRRSLAEFVYAGGGLMGVHGTSVAFTRWPGAHEDWPEFARMLGARGASHLAANERSSIALDDPGHPLTASFPQGGFEHEDEFFRFHDPYSRKRLRVLLRMASTPPGARPFRADGDYAVAWIRRYGRGRVFYCSLAHHPRVFWDPALLRFYLDATQFVLGDLPAPTTPSAMLNPAIRAQEALGWRKGLEVVGGTHIGLFELADGAAGLGVPFIGAFEGQRLETDMPAILDPSLGDEAFERMRLKLDASGVTLLTYRVKNPPANAPAWEGLFRFARKVGAETIIVESLPRDLSAASALCEQHDVRLALMEQAPGRILEACKNQSPRIGACADLSWWSFAGIDAAAAVRQLGSRLITVAAHGASLNDKARAENTLAALRDTGALPTMFALGWCRSRPPARETSAAFDALCLTLKDQAMPTGRAP